MPTYERADKSVERLAEELIAKYESHKPLAACEVKIDFLFARGDVNDKGVQLNDAITVSGYKALGVARVISAKDRAMGRGDAEVMLDGDYWPTATEDEQAALLDHELHHISVKADRAGNAQYDDSGRPQIKLRKHDANFGWFKCIAERHGKSSIEQQQAKKLMDNAGQFFWPDLAPLLDRVTITGAGKSVTMPLGTFAKAAATMEKKL